MNRRGFILAAGSVAAAGFPGTSRALTQSEASDLANEVLYEIQSAIDTGARGDELYTIFETIMRKYGDVEYISRGALGRGVDATDEQFQEYSDAFVSFVSRKYGQLFKSIIGATLEVRQLIPLSKQRYEVRTSANLRGWDPFDVTLLLHTRQGRDMFYNIEIEGVNILLSERKGIREMLDDAGNDIVRLTEVLNSDETAEAPWK